MRNVRASETILFTTSNATPYAHANPLKKKKNQKIGSPGRRDMGPKASAYDVRLMALGYRARPHMQLFYVRLGRRSGGLRLPSRYLIDIHGHVVKTSLLVLSGKSR